MFYFDIIINRKWQCYKSRTQWTKYQTTPRYDTTRQLTS